MKRSRRAISFNLQKEQIKVRILNPQLFVFLHEIPESGFTCSEQTVLMFLKMQTPDYSIIIPYKIRDIISLICENRGVGFIDALAFLYKSELYDYLCKESTKLWHLSPYKLFDLLEEEEKNKKFEFPDFV